FGVKKALLHVPVRRPDRCWWIRVHPDPAYRLEPAAVLDDDRETYLVTPEVYEYVTAEAVRKVIVTAVTTTGVVFLWPIRLPGTDGRLDDWSRTAQEAAVLAMTKWVRLVSNLQLGAYEICEATTTPRQPEWPSESFNRLIQIAFKDRIITTLDHPVLRRRRGEI